MTGEPEKHEKIPFRVQKVTSLAGECSGCQGFTDALEGYQACQWESFFVQN